MPCAPYVPQDEELVYLITDYRPGWGAGEIWNRPCWLFKREKELKTNTHWTLSMREAHMSAQWIFMKPQRGSYHQPHFTGKNTDCINNLVKSHTASQWWNLESQAGLMAKPELFAPFIVPPPRSEAHSTPRRCHSLNVSFYFWKYYLVLLKSLIYIV